MTAPSFQERKALYLSPAQNTVSKLSKRNTDLHAAAKSAHIDIQQGGRVVTVSKSSTIVDVANQLSRANEESIRIVFEAGEPMLIYNFLLPVVLQLAKIGSDVSALVRLGDQHHPVGIPTIAKTRRILEPGAEIIGPLQWRRHFAPLQRVEDVDIPWSEKSKTLVWRGVTSGPAKFDPVRLGQSRAWVAELAGRNQGNEAINVGYSAIVHPKRWAQNPSVRQWLRPQMSIEEQLTAKYLLCLEGNDVATGLKWMMGSNSCVLMPHPSIESWFCESLLQPWEHYVPISPDLNDVEDALEWCLDNDEKAEEIGRRGREYALSFLDLDQESCLFAEVMSWWNGEPLIQEIISLLREINK